MVEFEEACELILEKTGRLGTEKRLIEDAVGYVLAQDVVSQVNVAPFRNSAMDGYAVNSQWLAGCSTDNRKVIRMHSTSFAGDPSSGSVPDGCGISVMTGAHVPDEFDAVVPFEETTRTDAGVCFSKPAVPGQHVREPGEDIARGQKLFAEGTVLGRLDIGILATIGLRSVQTYRKPSAVIVGTGGELVDPGDELVDGKIYDSNTFTILSMVRPFCDEVQRICRVPDEKEELEDALGSPHDVVVTSGGVSVGERDLVVDVAESHGWRRVFHKVRIKPGKPFYFAVRQRQILFGLPGNPLSAAVTCAVFVIPALKKMAGLPDYRLRAKPARLTLEETLKPGRKLIWPGFIGEEAGRTVARFSPKKSSAALTALLGTDGLLVQRDMDKGTGSPMVDTIPWSDILEA